MFQSTTIFPFCNNRCPIYFWIWFLQGVCDSEFALNTNYWDAPWYSRLSLLLASSARLAHVLHFSSLLAWAKDNYFDFAMTRQDTLISSLLCPLFKVSIKKNTEASYYYPVRSQSFSSYGIIEILSIKVQKAINQSLFILIRIRRRVVVHQENRVAAATRKLLQLGWTPSQLRGCDHQPLSSNEKERILLLPCSGGQSQKNLSSPLHTHWTFSGDF